MLVVRFAGAGAHFNQSGIGRGLTVKALSALMAR